MTIKHLLSIDDLSSAQAKQLIARANELKASDAEQYPSFSSKHAASLFYENSTRTLMSFGLAAQRCGLPLLSLPMQQSSEKKGEVFLDTLFNLHAMGFHLLIIRHMQSHLFASVREKLPQGLHLLNAGDGENEHPTQALLDMMTIMERHSDLRGLKIVVVGNLKHSRVLHSFQKLCLSLGVTNLWQVAPALWQPKQVIVGQLTDNLDEGLKEADVVITLRIQHERISAEEQYDKSEYQRLYALNEERFKLAKPEAMLLHPGPVNRGVEVTSMLADGPQSWILRQVENGVFMRMAILEALLK